VVDAGLLPVLLAGVCASSWLDEALKACIGASVSTGVGGSCWHPLPVV